MAIILNPEPQWQSTNERTRIANLNCTSLPNFGQLSRKINKQQGKKIYWWMGFQPTAEKIIKISEQVLSMSYACLLYTSDAADEDSPV